MVDFTYKYDDSVDLTNSCTSLTLLDHHATAQAALEPILKKGQSARSLRYDKEWGYLGMGVI